MLHASAHFDRVLYDGGEFGTATAPGSPEEEDFLGLPGLLEPEQVAHLLRKRQADQLKTRSRAAGDGGVAGPARPAAARAGRLRARRLRRVRRGRRPGGRFGPGRVALRRPRAWPPPGHSRAGRRRDAAPPVSRETLAALRKELNGLVAAWNHRTGQPHGVIHADLRRACGGPPLPQATADQIRARIDMIRTWAAARR